MDAYMTTQSIVGTCTEVDKTFTRSAEVPDPALIRT